MISSEKIDLLAKAFVAAQAELEAVPKAQTAKIEGRGAQYSYRYADLAAVWGSIRAILAKHKLGVFQSPATLHESTASVTTRLIHESGQWIESDPLTLGTGDGRPQTVGSAVTYARRYSLASMLGIVADEDDDGAAAHNTEAPKKALLGAEGAATLAKHLADRGVAMKELRVEMYKLRLFDALRGVEATPEQWPESVIPELKKILAKWPVQEAKPAAPEAPDATPELVIKSVEAKWAKAMGKNKPSFGEPKTAKQMADIMLKGSDWNEIPEGPMRLRQMLEDLEQGLVIFPTGHKIPF